MSNSHVKTKILFTHNVLHSNWIDSDWDTFVLLLCDDLLISLLLLELKLINSYANAHIKLGISHDVFGNNWVDTYWNTLFCDQILHLSGILSKFECDWGWLVSNKGLHGTLGDVVIHKGENSIRVLLLLLLGELEGDWRWLIGDEGLHGSFGNVVIHERKDGI